MAEMKHYGVLGMRWGKRKGGQSVTVGRGVRGAAKEVGGLLKDAAKDDVDKVTNIARGIAKAFKAAKEGQQSADHKVVTTLRKKKVSALSNEEIRTIKTRLELEKQLKELSGTDKNRGRSFLKGILSNKTAMSILSGVIKGAAEAARRRRAQQEAGV